MTFQELLVYLKKTEITVGFSSGKLQYSGPEEGITPEIIEELKKYKSKLIKHFWPKELGNLMPIHPAGSKIPLFVVHGDNSNYLISEYFGPDQPVYGFFHPGSEGERINYRSAVEQAGDYLEKVLSVAPQGPYYLIGYSYGGILAFEMAVRLQKAGNKVPFLVLIDTASPYTHEPKVLYNNAFETIRFNFLRPLRKIFKHWMHLLVCEFYLLRGKPIPVEKRAYYMWIRYLNLTRKYTPEKFDGDMLLVRTTENPSKDRYLGWENLVNNIRLVEVDGGHLEVFVGKEKISKLTSEIEKFLNDAGRQN
jgi:thioesterase domain-containing protein